GVRPGRCTRSRGVSRVNREPISSIVAFGRDAQNERGTGRWREPIRTVKATRVMSVTAWMEACRLGVRDGRRLRNKGARRREAIPSKKTPREEIGPAFSPGSGGGDRGAP